MFLIASSGREDKGKYYPATISGPLEDAGEDIAWRWTTLEIYEKE
jgi:hypothetical protein